MNSVGCWNKLVVVYLKIKFKGLLALNEEARELSFCDRVSGS
jgi:hypothetical protein